MPNFGENLKRIRMERQLTQEQLADLLGTSKQVISRYENGQRSPKVSIVDEYARKLGVSISELTGVNRASSHPDPVMAEREALRRDPDRRVLLDLAERGTAADVKQVRAIIDALRATNPDFYDGDDPA